MLITSIPVGFANEDNQDDTEIASTTIHLSKSALENAGIERQTLQEIQLNPELIAYGLILNIQELLDIKNQLAITTAEYATAKANFIQEQQTLKRLLTLHKNKAIANRKLQIQQTSWRAKKTVLDSTQLQRQAIIQNVKLNWGEMILHWITDPNDSHLTRIISGKKVLLSLTLSGNQTLPLDTKSIYIDPTGDRSKAKLAEFLSAAPQSDNSSQGERYFFVTHVGLRSGLHISAWLPQRKAISGVIIPQNALIWHLGQTFVYQETEPENFVRYNVSKPTKTPEGLFISDHNLIGKTLVIVGAQTLLSEELKRRIPDEDDD